MIIKYYPDKKTVEEAMQVDDPLLMLVSYDGNEVLLANIDDAFEHIILLRNMNYNETDIDKYYRVVVNQEGADWTFVCPNDYNSIKDKNIRIENFYNDGVIKITEAINAIGYKSEINIPKRYRRHFNLLQE